MSSVTMNLPTWLLAVVVGVILVSMVLQVLSLFLQRAIKRLDRDLILLKANVESAELAYELRYGKREKDSAPVAR